VQNDTVLVLTYKGVDTMLKEGGCGYWRANAHSLSSCKYLVATRNARRAEREGDEPHGAAFFVGEINGVRADRDRYVVTFSRYAVLEAAVEGVWTSGGSNPVHYAEFKTLKKMSKNLEWQDWPATHTEKVVDRPLTITQAKAGLAMTFGVDPSQIDIVIKG
jgi:hypothetical protein